MKNKIVFPFYIFIPIFISSILFVLPNWAFANKPVVHAVLFFSPTCPHCHKVLSEDLPALQETFDDQLDISLVDVSETIGRDLYMAAIERFAIPQDRLGVPTLIVGQQVLVGSNEISMLFPEIIESGIDQGGISWPDIPGLEKIIQQEEVLSETNPSSEASNRTIENSRNSRWLANFQRDPIGNSIAVVVLVGMIICVFFIGFQVFMSDPTFTKEFHKNSIPILCLFGLIVAGYLSFVEFSQTDAICGPVGDCNAVQQSPYAYLFGQIPIGFLGIAGFFFMLIIWILQNYVFQNFHETLAKILWGSALFGVFFSIYLTFLEPFVIGATCAWCIASALIMTAIFILASPAILRSLKVD